MVRYPPLALSFRQAHLCDTPFCNIYRAIIVRYPKKTSTKEFCDTIAASIARYEKYRSWASKPPTKASFYGEFCRSRLTTFKRDLSFQARQFFFSRFRPLGGGGQVGFDRGLLSESGFRVFPWFSWWNLGYSKGGLFSKYPHLVVSKKRTNHPLP